MIRRLAAVVAAAILLLIVGGVTPAHADPVTPKQKFDATIEQQIGDPLTAAAGAVGGAAHGACSHLPGILKTGCDVAVAPLTLGAKAVAQAANAVSCAVDFGGCMSSAFGNAAKTYAGLLGKAVSSTTNINPAHKGFLEMYRTMFGIAVIPIFAMTVLAVAKAKRSRDAIEAAFIRTTLAVALTSFLPVIVWAALLVTDEIANVISATAAHDLDNLLRNVGTAVTAANLIPAFGGWVGVMLVGLVITGCAVVLWIELSLRAAAVYLVMGCGPLVVAGLVDSRAGEHVKRYGYFLGALIASKLLVVFTLSMATVLAGNSPTVATVFAAAGLLLLACFALPLLLRLVPWFGDHLGGVVGARGHLANAGPMAAVPGPSQLARQSMSSHLSHSGGGGGAGKSGRSGQGGPSGGTQALQSVSQHQPRQQPPATGHPAATPAATPPSRPSPAAAAAALPPSTSGARR